MSKPLKMYLVYRIAMANGKRISEAMIGSVRSTDGAAAKQAACTLYPFRPCEELFVRQAKSKKDKAKAEELELAFHRQEAEMRAIMEKAG